MKGTKGMLAVAMGMSLLAGALSLGAFAMPAAAQSGGNGAPVFVTAIDWSGSTLQTDPAGYSVAAAQLRGDLVAPGHYLVMPFSGNGAGCANGAAVRVLGPYDLAGPTDALALQQRMDQLEGSLGSRCGSTPLAQLVSTAYATLQGLDAPSESNLTIVTDGLPDPNPGEQYAQIDQSLPKWRQHGWTISVIGLGAANSPWFGPLSQLAARTRGVATDVSQPAGLLQAFMSQWAQLAGLPSPHSWTQSLPGSGAKTHRFAFDPTVRDAWIAVTRPGPDVSLALYPPGTDQPLSPSDPRVAARFSDPHFILLHLSSANALGAGTWRAVITGPAGAPVGGAAFYASHLSLSLVSPSIGELLPVNQPFDVVAALMNGSQPLLRGKISLHFEISSADGRDAVVGSLKDDGNRSSDGDQYAGDGYYTAKVQLATPGAYTYRLWGTLDGQALPEESGSLSADAFPALQALPLPGAFHVAAGARVTFNLARLVVGAQPADPSGLGALTLTVANAQGQIISRQTLDPRTAFQHGVLQVSFQPRQADGRFVGNQRGGTSDATYTLRVVAMQGTWLGQSYTEPLALVEPVRTVMELPEPLGHLLRREAIDLLRHWALVALAVLTAAAIWTLWRRSRWPRFRGVLQPVSFGRARRTAAPLDLSGLNARMPLRRRALPRPWIAGGNLDTRLRGVDLGSWGGHAHVRRSANAASDWSLGGQPLTRRWQRLSQFARLEGLEAAFDFEEERRSADAASAPLRSGRHGRRLSW